jgi:class 3 adenylate cyclase
MDIEGVDWVMVTEQETGESRDELERYLVSIGIVLAILLPLLAVAGVLIARRMARPVTPLVDAAGSIADGEYEEDVPEFGRNELGDVARQLGLIADDLAERQRALEDEERRIEAMLGSVVPDELVTPVREGNLDDADHVDTGTVVAIAVHGVPDATGAEQDAVLDLTSRLADELNALAEAAGVERLRVATDEQLFVTGRGRPGAAGDEATAFAADAIEHIHELGDEFGLPLGAVAGLSIGPVATGVLGGRQLTFGVWGDAFTRALTLVARTGDDALVVVDRSVVDELGDEWSASEIGDDRFSVTRSGPR